MGKIWEFLGWYSSIFLGIQGKIPKKSQISVGDRGSIFGEFGHPSTYPYPIFQLKIKCIQ